jgi:hypothetical protein
MAWRQVAEVRAHHILTAAARKSLLSRARQQAVDVADVTLIFAGW